MRLFLGFVVCTAVLACSEPGSNSVAAGRDHADQLDTGDAGAAPEQFDAGDAGPDGRAGCVSHCESDAGHGQPSAFYDVAWAKRLEFKDLHVSEVGRASAFDGGVEVIGFRWSAFDQPFVASDGGLMSLPWRQHGVLCLPTVPAGPAPTRGLLYNLHDVSPASSDMATLCEGIAAAFSIPVLFHGWEPDVVAPLDGLTYHATQFPMFERFLAAGFVDAGSLPMDGRYMLNPSPLAKGRFGGGDGAPTTCRPRARLDCERGRRDRHF